MMVTQQAKNVGTDLFLVVELLLSGWKIIFACMLLGGLIGFTVSFTLPEKFQASASIEGGKVLGKEVEPVAVIAERMRSPSFYSIGTLAACQMSISADPGRALVSMLSPNVGRESTFVDIRAKLLSPKLAQDCLLAVLGDVRVSQNEIFGALESSSRSELEQLKGELLRNEKRRELEISLFSDQIVELNRALSGTEEFLRNAKLGEDSLNVSDEKFSASSLLASIVATKETEALRLREKLLELESRVLSKSGLPETEGAIADLTLKIITLDGKLRFPVTHEAAFSTPIVSSQNKVEPRRFQLLALGLVLGTCAGLMVLIFRNFVSELRRRRAGT